MAPEGFSHLAFVLIVSMCVLVSLCALSLGWLSSVSIEDYRDLEGVFPTSLIFLQVLVIDTASRN